MSTSGTMPLSHVANVQNCCGLFGWGTLGATLRIVRRAFESCEVIFVTVHDAYRSQVPKNKFYVVNDANRWNWLGLENSV